MAAPGLLDRLLASQGYSGQMTAEPEDPTRPDNLFHPVAGRHASHGRFDIMSRPGVAAVNPALLRGAGLGALALALALLARRPWRRD